MTKIARLTSFGLRASSLFRASSFRDTRSHFLFLIRAGVSLFSADEAAIVKIDKCIVHELHALLFAGLNDAGQHVGFCFANDVGDRRRVGQRFQREDTTLAIGTWDQLLK